MKYQLLLILSLGFLLVSCKSEEEKAREQVIEKIEKSWTLLDTASKQKETNLSIPMGFMLGCTYNEFVKQCDTLIKKNGGSHHYFQMRNEKRPHIMSTNLMTKEFGGVEREVMIEHYNYSHPKEKYVNKISFGFIEFCSNYNSNGGWEKLRDFISYKFDESWETVDFNLEELKPSLYGEYYKYWVRGNMAVVFYYKRYPVLEFYNVPKFGANKIKASVPTDDGDEDNWKYKEYDEKAATKERLDQWHKTYREWLRHQ